MSANNLPPTRLQRWEQLGGTSPHVSPSACNSNWKLTIELLLNVEHDGSHEGVAQDEAAVFLLQFIAQAIFGINKSAL